MNRQKTSSFGKKLKAIRENRGITKREAARLAEITETTYDSYEYQRREPTLHNLVKIAKALDVTPNELLGYQVPASENKEENKEENSGKTYWLIYTENLSDYSIGRSTTFKLAVREAEAELGRSLSKSEKPYAVQVDRELTPCILTITLSRTCFNQPKKMASSLAMELTTTFQKSLSGRSTLSSERHWA